VNPAIAARGLTRTFALPGNPPPPPRVAVDALTFAVAPGEVFGLLGPDGAGKTTTLRLLTGLIDPSSGEAEVAGAPLPRLEEARERIGYMSQRFGLYEDLTVDENLRFFGDLMGVTGAVFAERRARLLAFSGMTPFGGRLAGDLSGGMKQKLGLSCALLHTPEVLFLDEPTNGVDPVSRRDFWRILAELRGQGVTILVSTSYLDEAERCDRLGFLHRGRLLAQGTPGEVRGAHLTLEDAFVALVGGQDDG
jgi:ABC-2 type transport system ATP-binding protein